MLLSAPMNHVPHDVSSIPMLTTTVMKTPNMSIITCIDVDACAGSTLVAFSPSGSTDPRQTLRNTIDVRDVVTATNSAKGVTKHMARTYGGEGEGHFELHPDEISLGVLVQRTNSKAADH